MYSVFLLLLATVATLFYLWQKRTYSYWERMGIKYIKPLPVLGNLKQFLTGQMAFFEQFNKLHNEPGFEKEPVVGIYMVQGPALLIRDLDLVKTVMVKKFNYFSNRAMHADPHHDPLGSNNLFFVRNPEWKELRSKISPVFTSGKIKQMYPLMAEVGKDLEWNLSQRPNGQLMPLKELCSRFTTDLIGTTAFGVKANALRDLKSEFYKHSIAIFEPSLSRAKDFAIIFMLPALVSLARVKLFSKSTTEFLRGSITHVLDERERSGIKRNDLIDILVAMKKEALAQNDKSNKALDIDYLVSQAAFFQTAGFETSSSTMTWALYELAHYPDMQDRLREEILDAFGDEDHVGYELIQEMPYLTQVANETLRKYPIVGYAERECTQPETGERFNLAPYYNYELPNRMPVYVSALAIHRDPQYWPEPEKFDPERFAPENRSTLNMDAYMPFGVGPHNCVGMRLGLLQSKLGLVHLLRNHRVSLCDKTVKEVKFQPLCVVLSSKEDIILKLERC